MRRLAAIALIGIAACAEPLPPLEGVDLPLASMPDEVGPSGWSVAFVHDFEDGFWDEGEHVYQLSLDCPPLMNQPQATPPIFFEVQRLAVPVDHVYLRLSGLADSRLGPPNVSAINPLQTTSAVITVVGVTESAATQAAAECVGQVSWDLRGSADLVALEPIEP